MTISMIQERRASLQAEFERLRSHLEALSGAIQDCDYWLTVVDEASASPTPDPELKDN